MNGPTEKIGVMYDTILIPTDGSTSAMRGAKHGVDLAAELDATVHSLFVIEAATNPWNRDSLEEQMDDAEAYGKEQTGKVVEMGEEVGVEVVQDTEVGANIPKEIMEYAEEEDMDAIVMGSAFRGSLGGLLGSTAEKVVRVTDLPVMVISETA
jgi:nucleotide-binding universal stress UspA family protein